jgi:hypothetical protein
MDPRFEPYFRARVQQIRSEALSGTLVTGEPLAWAQFGSSPEQVLSAIQQGIEPYDRTSPRLRPDGELLLYLAFTELVARPVAIVRRGQVSPNEVLADISSDVAFIRQRAVGDGPGSVHDVINATSTSWDYLKTAGLQLWD